VGAVRSAVARSPLAAEDAEYVCNAICTLTPVPPQQSAGVRPQAIEEQLVAPALATWHACAAALGVPVAAAPAPSPPSARRQERSRAPRATRGAA
jgi:hypothetical protein